MEIEKFSGTEDQGKYVGHFDGVAGSTASEASRSDANAHPIRRLDPRSWREELNALVARRQMVELQLKELLHKMKLQHKEHLAAGGSIAAWAKIERQIFARREQLVEEQISLEQRIREVRPRAHREQREEAEAGSPMLQVLVEIRELLRSVVRQTGASAATGASSSAKEQK